MLPPEVTRAMELAMPDFPPDAEPGDAGSRRFDPVQLQTFAFKAMENLLASGIMLHGITLTGHQLKSALEQAWPDGAADPDQGDTVVTLVKRLEPFDARDEEDETVRLPAGVYLSFDDIADAGIFPVSDAPTALSSAAQLEEPA